MFPIDNLQRARNAAIAAVTMAQILESSEQAANQLLKASTKVLESPEEDGFRVDVPDEQPNDRGEPASPACAREFDGESNVVRLENRLGETEVSV
jgi:hypothetical protein